jgi:hypothetical protein
MQYTLEGPQEQSAECLVFCDFQYGKHRTVATWLKIPILGNEKSRR